MDELGTFNKQRIGPILWREKYIILASVVVMVVLAAAYTVSQSKVYSASGLLEVNVATATPGSSDTASANQALAQNYSTLLVSPGFLSQVRPQVDGGKLSLDSLQSRLSATVPASSALVRLTATGPSPGEAQNVAQQVITGFLANLQSTAATRTAQLQGQLQQSIANLNAQISALRASGANPESISALNASRQALINQNATLVANGVAQGTSVTESAAPVASSSPTSPKRSLNLLGGLLLGVLLGVALAWARQALRPAIHSADDVTSLVDVPLLASIPLKPRLKADDPALPEAYRVLHAKLMFALRSDDLQVVTFVGSAREVGNTSVVEGLAKAASGGDRQVLVVDGDMRAGALSARFGHLNRPGLVDVLQGTIPLEKALVQLEEGIWLLPTRTSLVNAASLLAGGQTSALMAQVRERFDLVLIDSPPLAGLADGLILASQSDVVVLVARAGVTKPADLTAIMHTLHTNMTSVAGAVVFEDLPAEQYESGPDRAKTASPVATS